MGLLLDDFALETLPNEEKDKQYIFKSVPFYSFAIMGTVPNKINVLPRPGTYKHRVYGTVTVTRETNEEFINNFNAAVYQEKIPIDLEHETILSGAVGYMLAGTGSVDENGGGWVEVEWNERGLQMLSEGRFCYFSPAWVRAWEDPANGKKFNNVIVGGALTNSPFYKDKALKPLFANDLIQGDLPKEEDMTQNATQTPPANPPSQVPTFSLEEFNALKAQIEELKSAKPVVDPEEFNTLKAQLVEANKKTAETEQKARVRLFTEIIRGIDGEGDGSEKFRGDPIVHATVLEALHTQFGEGSKEFNDYVADQRAIAKQLNESELLKNRGGGGSNEPTSDTGNEHVKKFNDLISAKMTELKVPYKDALSIASKEDPDLARKARRASYDRTSGDSE